MLCNPSHAACGATRHLVSKSTGGGHICTAVAQSIVTHALGLEWRSVHLHWADMLVMQWFSRSHPSKCDSHLVSPLLSDPDCIRLLLQSPAHWLACSRHDLSLAFVLAVLTRMEYECCSPQIGNNCHTGHPTFGSFAFRFNRQLRI
jgi:hypothetical protein